MSPELPEDDGFPGFPGPPDVATPGGRHTRPGSSVNADELAGWARTKRRQLDAQGDRLAALVRSSHADAQRRLLRLGVLLAVAVAVVAWVASRRTASAKAHEALWAWWHQHYDASPLATGRTPPPMASPAWRPAALSLQDVTAQLDYPMFARARQLTFTGTTVSTAGARFVARLLSTHGVTAGIGYAHWHGWGRGPAELLAQPPQALAASCTSVDGSSARRVSGVGVPWPEMVDAWCARRLLRTGELVVPPHWSRGRARHALGPGEEYINPWARALPLRSDVDMMQSAGVQEYLCAHSRTTSVLHVLFARGIAGVATECCSDDEAERSAIAVYTALFGSDSALSSDPQTCPMQRAMRGMDAFAIGTSVASMAAGIFPAAVIPIALLGVAGSGAAGLVAARGGDCGLPLKVRGVSS